MAYLLISVINSKSKSLVSCKGDRVQFRWPRLGLYDGTVVGSSGSYLRVDMFCTICTDSKREMEEEAKRMAHEDHTQAGDKHEDKNRLLNFW